MYNVLSAVNDSFILPFIILRPFRAFVSFSWLTTLAGTFSTMVNEVEIVDFLVLFIIIVLKILFIYF